MTAKRNTNEELKDDLLKVAEDLGRAPTYHEYDVFGRHNARTLSERFGSWKDAIESAGLLSEYPSRKIEESELLNDLNAVAEQLGKTPSIPQYDVFGNFSVDTCKKRFGTWNDAVEAAGLTPNEKQRRVGEDELIEDMKRVAGILSKTPTTREYNRLGQYTATTVRNRFGGWSDAIGRAGLEPEYDAHGGGLPIPKEELLADLQRVADELDRAPTWEEYREMGEYSPVTINEKFESWSDAIELTGYESRDSGGARETVSDDELLADLKRVVEKLGYPPMKSEYTERGKYHGATVSRRFGGWDEAMGELGIDYNLREVHPMRVIDDEELLLDLAKVAFELDDPPSKSEYDERGKYSSSTMERRFPGSWNLLSKEAYMMADEIVQ